MTNVKGFSPESGSAPAAPIPHDLPAIPGSPDAKLQAVIDAWDNRIPTARHAAGSYTRESLDAAIKADASDSDRWLPKLPGQRRSPEQPTPKVPGQRQGAYYRELLGFQYDGLAADAAFGSAS